jgi:diguanylate cyclase (GGDEF)-like protein
MDERPPAAMQDADVALGQLQRELADGRDRLRELRREIERAETHRDGSYAANLLEANEQLVLGILAAQGTWPTAMLDEQRRPFALQIDRLTGLPNRALLLDRFACAAAGARRRDHRMAVLFIDLDEFKQINDRLGHAAGDEVLVHAAACFAGAVRGIDTVCRYGADEFVVLLAELGDRSDAEQVAGKILSALAVPAVVGAHTLSLAASIGVSVYPDDGEDVALLIRRADAAMVRASRHGSGRLALHGAPLPGRARLRPARPAVSLRSLREDASTHRKALHEAQLQEANEHLLLAVLGAQELQATAEKSLGDQSSLLAVVAHELRNPLGPIRAAASMLDRVEPDALPRLRAVIERQVQHVTRLIGDLLDLSRIDSGKLRLQRGLVDLAVLVEESVEACRPALDVRGQRLEVRMPPGPLPLDGDPLRLVQVLTNLLDNASKYTPERGALHLDVEVYPEAYVLSVEDDGIGITPEALPHIFEPFVQDLHATRFNAAGLGIGLAVVRELVEAHQGTVAVYSPGQGHGSRFVVTLPRGQDGE